jgi:hypothetical protein
MADIASYLTLWLTPEQIKLIQTVLGTTVPDLRIEGSPGVIMKYGLKLDNPTPCSQGGQLLALTPEQKKQIQSAGITPCDYVEVSPLMTLKYGISLPTYPSGGYVPITKYGITVPPAIVLKYGICPPP